MTTDTNFIAILNDLVKINNDRITGYEKAIDESKSEDIDLKGLFQNMANESKQYVTELSSLVAKHGGEPTTDSTTSGKIYRAWMDVKAPFTGSGRKALLSACEFGEDAAQKAYDAALASDAEIDVDSRQLIMEQKMSLKKSHDVIKKYRNLQPEMA